MILNFLYDLYTLGLFIDLSKNFIPLTTLKVWFKK